MFPQIFPIIFKVGIKKVQKRQQFGFCVKKRPFFQNKNECIYFAHFMKIFRLIHILLTELFKKSIFLEVFSKLYQFLKCSHGQLPTISMLPTQPTYNSLRLDQMLDLMPSVDGIRFVLLQLYHYIIYHYTCLPIS